MRVNAVHGVPPVKLVIAVLFREDALLDRALIELTGLFSRPDYIGAVHPFEKTRYYEPEMGTGLKRVVASFTSLIDPASLVAIKWQTAALEEVFREGAGRRVNIDPGYLDFFKVVLASFKGSGHKIYLGRGVWADPTVYYKHGRFRCFEWSFPDFKAGFYDKDLLTIRRGFKRQRRDIRKRSTDEGAI